jgi:hypothetical protein
MISSTMAYPNTLLAVEVVIERSLGDIAGGQNSIDADNLEA